MCSYVILPKEMKIDEFINKKFTDTSFKTMCDNLSYKKINFWLNRPFIFIITSKDRQVMNGGFLFLAKIENC